MPIPAQKVYEKVPTDNFVNAVIEKVTFEEAHEFKFKEQTTTHAGVRFEFRIEGMKFLHQSRWMKFYYAEKSSLFNKFIVPLVEGAHKNMEFDIDRMEGMKVKMLWKDEPSGYQSIETVRPAGAKLPFITGSLTEALKDETSEDQIPF